MMNVKSIKFKVIALMIGSLFILAISLLYISVSKTSEALVAGNIALLDAVKESKKDHVVDFFGSLENLLQSKVADSQTVQTLWALDEAFEEFEEIDQLSDEKLNKKISEYYQSHYIGAINYDIQGANPKKSLEQMLPASKSAKIAQYLYIVANEYRIGEKDKLFMSKRYQENYSGIHLQAQYSYKHTKDNYGLNDINLINANGDVIYSVSKNNDFGTNILNGVYANSPLAEIFKRASALKRGSVTFSDFSVYEPNYNAPVLFMAAPLYYKDDFEGVIVLQVLKNKINDVMNFKGNYVKAGLGQTGKAMLLSSKSVMQNDSRFVDKSTDKSVKVAGTTVSILRVNTGSADAIGKGRNGSWIIDDDQGVKVLSSYATIPLMDQIWGIIVEIDESEVLANAHDIRNIIVGISLIVMFILFLISIYFVQKIIITKLQTLQKASYDLAQGEGDLTQKIEVPSGDEISEVAHNINDFINKVRITVSEAKSSSSQNADISQILSDTSLGMKAKATKESQLVQSVSAQGVDLQNILAQSISQAKDTKQNVDEAGKLLRNANDKIIHLVEEVETRAEDELELSGRLESLSQEAKQVKDVLNVISDIADQTNLLALNAAIEAARAGEHGYGFAVVADEVRKLADRTQRSLSEIQATISVIVQSVIDASDSISRNAKEIESLSEHASLAGDEIKEGVESIEDVIIQVDKTVTGYIENSKTVESMISKVGDIEDISADNKKSMDDISNEASKLTNMTLGLNNMLKGYRT